jgi:hypothetical protein
MNPLFEAALEVQRFFKERRWRFAFIGGLAVIRWGKPRATSDVDVTLLTGFGPEERYLTELLAHFRPRVPNAAEFALKARVALLKTLKGPDLDISLGGMPFEEQVVERASPFAFAPECTLLTCSGEDLVVLKAFADRHLDWGDIVGILRRQGGRLDRAYVLEQLYELCIIKDDLSAVERLRTLMKETP